MIKAIFVAAAAMVLAAASDDRTAVDDLGWMSGHWTTAPDESWAEEIWLEPRAGLMLGLGRAGRGEALEDWEYMRVEADAEGVPVLWASQRGRSAVGFALVRGDASSAVFENAAHDFPQRIAFRRSGEEMTATISALDGGHAMSWTYRHR
jgi:hypothetical protein